MTNSLYHHNTPANFWKLQLDPEPGDQAWAAAVDRAAAVLTTQVTGGRHAAELIAERTLGEGQFGPDHWHLSAARRTYYAVKPLLPRPVIGLLRRVVQRSAQDDFALGFPVEPRLAEYQWSLLAHLLEQAGVDQARFIHFWPQGRQYALVLTHDIETAAGQSGVRKLADLEESLGFRSSFNFIPERYPLDQRLMQELRDRGFEIGVHGLKHDGKLFRSRAEFERRAVKINGYLRSFGAVGFRAPLTHRNPEWMQALNLEYDLSFFDTDPYEPIPGGTMSVWPFWMGRFIELPYTLVQDYTLLTLLGQTTPQLWLDKLDFIARYCGMALLNSHPDYLSNPQSLGVYASFLQAVKNRGGYWHALPREVAAWWRARTDAASAHSLPGAVEADARLADGRLTIVLRQAAAAPA